MSQPIAPPPVGTTVMLHMLENHNGTHEHPAIVTRCWGNVPGSCVNVKAIPDCGEIRDVTSVFVYESADAGKASGNQIYAYLAAKE